MEVLERPVAEVAAAPAPEAPCAHCGLPVGAAPVGEGPYFCCTGCAVVHEALRAAGLDAGYYRLRELGDTRQPAARPVRADRAAELDTQPFLDKHTRLLPDGTRQVTLFLDGVHCAACVWLVERLPFEKPGITSARLDLSRAQLTLAFDPAQVRLSEVAAWLARFGYDTHPARLDGVQGRTEAERRLLVKLGVCWALAGNAMLLAFALYSGLEGEAGPLAHFARVISLLLATGSMLYGGPEFFRRAWASVRQAWQRQSLRGLHMDTPISIGILGGYAHSAWATVTGQGEVWFDSIMVLIAALLTARWLQLRARRLAGNASDRLLSLVPATARRVSDDGHVEVVHTDELAVGDRVEVPAGEVVPVDGIVVSGVSSLNNAVLTGESRPERVAPGDAVEAGATNLSTPLVIKTAAAGAQTRVGRLMVWVRDRADRKPPALLLVDRIGAYFVAGVIALSVVCFALWLPAGADRAVHNLVALLVISCPCALGMATPLSYAVGVGRAARRGLFVKREDALETLTHTTCVVFDKTGTLTEGSLALAAWKGDADALSRAAALERASNHPIARALTAAGRAPMPDPEDVVVTAGAGLTGRVEGVRVAVGKPDWITQQANFSPAQRETLADYAARGLTPVAVAIEDEVAAVLGFGDTLRGDAAPFISELQAAGIVVHLLSGDHEAVVRRVGTELGLPADAVRGGVSPEDKQAFVAALATRHTVVMVGDGVNDAAALQEAHVGIAVAGGTTASLVAADVFVTRPGLAPVRELFSGARSVTSVVRTGLTLSLLYNAGGALAAVAGLVTPLVAAVAMPASSLAVVGLAILQRSFRDPARRP